MPPNPRRLKEKLPYVAATCVGVAAGLTALGISQIPEQPPKELHTFTGDYLEVCDGSYVAPTELVPNSPLKRSFDVIVRPVIHQGRIYAYSSSMEDETYLTRIDTKGGYWLDTLGRKTDQTTCHSLINFGRTATNGTIFLTAQLNSPAEISRIYDERSACRAGAFALWYGLKSEDEARLIGLTCYNE